jgi:hypothetical protein
VWVPTSSTNTKRSGSRLPTSMHQSTLKRTRLVLLPLWTFFSAPAQSPYCPTNCRFAYTNPRDGEQKLGSLGVGGPRPLLKVISEQLRGLLVELRSLGREPSSLGGCRALVEPFAVALERGAIYPEAAGRLCLLGHTLLHRFDDLLSEVQRVRFHASTLPGAASSQPAVTEGLESYLRDRRSSDLPPSHWPSH